MAVAVVEKFKQEVMYGLSAGTKKSGRCREVAVVVRFKQEVMYGLSVGTKKSGRCRVVAVSGGSTVHGSLQGKTGPEVGGDRMLDLSSMAKI